MNKEKWEEIGIAGVDSGQILIGDPCYYIRDANEGLSREEYLNNLGSNPIQLKYKMGHDGKGVIVNNFGGDGAYPIYVKRDENGRVTAAMIKFRG